MKEIRPINEVQTLPNGTRIGARLRTGQWFDTWATRAMMTSTLFERKGVWHRIDDCDGWTEIK